MLPRLTWHVRPLLLFLVLTLLSAVEANPAIGQNVPAEGLQLRLEREALEAGMASSAFRALDARLEAPTPFTAAVIHRHNGRWSVSVEQGRLEEGESPSRYLNDGVAEVLFYDRQLDGEERAAVDSYVAANYEDAPTTASASDDGVHVEGRWDVEILNTDGSLDQRFIFQNSLVDSLGPMLISNLLTGDRSAGLFFVTVEGSLDTDDQVGHPCEDNSGVRVPCKLLEEGASADAPNEFLTLEAFGGEEIILEGSFTAGVEGKIERVSTAIGECNPDTAPVNCVGLGEPLTEKRVDGTGGRSPEVEAGQQVSVEVVISFN